MKKSVLFLISALSLGAMVGCASNEPTQEVETLKIVIENPSKTELVIGETLKLAATAENNPNALPITWESSNVSVAKVDFNGNVTAVNKGTVDIVAKVGEIKSNKITLTVKEKDVVITINEPASKTLAVDDEITLTAKVENNVHNLPLTWESSDKTVASIDNNGKLVALKAGETKVKAKVGDFVSNEVAFIVNKKVIEVASVTLNASKTTLEVGETLSITASVLPEDATDKTVTLSTDSTKVMIDGMNVIARQVTAADEVVTIKGTSKNGKVGTLDLKIVTSYDSNLPKVKAKLLKSQEVEANELSSGSLTYVKTGKDNVKETEKTTTFEVYNDKATHIKEVEGESILETTRAITRAGVVTVQERTERNYNNELITDLTYDSGLKEFNKEGESDNQKINVDEANKYINYVDFNKTFDSARAGVSYSVVSDYLDNYNFFGNKDEATKDFSYKEINANEVELKTHLSTSSNHLYHTLNIKFYESGLIKGYTLTTDKYETDMDTLEQGPFIEKEVTTCVINNDARIASTGKVQDYSKYFIDSYDVLPSDSTWNPTLKTEYYINDKAYLNVQNVAPETYNEDFDGINVKSLSDPTVATIDYNWSGTPYLDFKKPCADLVVTLESKQKGITKEVHLVVKDIVLENFEVTGLKSKIWAGSSHSINVKATPTNAELDLTVTLIDNTAGAVVTQRKDFNENPIKGSYDLTVANAGAFTIKIVEKTLGEAKAYTNTVTVLDNSDENITKYVAEGTYSTSGGGMYTFSDFKLTQTGATNTGTYSMSVDGGVIEGTFEIKAGRFLYKETKNTTNSPLKVTGFNFYSSKGDYDTFNFTFEDDLYETYTARFFKN